MKTEDIKKMAQAWKQVQEASAEKPEEISEIARSMTPMRNMFGKSKAEKEAEAKKKEAEAKATKKEAMDPVDKSELKGKHKDRKDKDINNDGKVDSTDKYLHKRRKAVSNAIKKDQEVEVTTQESVEVEEAAVPKGTHKPNNGSPAGEGLSPSAKKELEKADKVPPEVVDEPTVDKKTFDAIRASAKKSPMRPNDNASGDKTMPKNDGK